MECLHQRSGNTWTRPWKRKLQDGCNSVKTGVYMTNTGPLKKILLLATGGTIVCTETAKGLQPHYTVADLLRCLPPSPARHKIDGRMVMNIDSSNMTPQRWLDIAHAIVAEYEKYDGFIITHGTDTMAYTAGALTYFLEGLNKPVVLTGSQYSMTATETDAIQNLSDSLLFACEDIAGVFICFDGKLINGPRAVKVKTTSYDAFASVNYPPVAVVKHNRITYNQAVYKHFKKADRSKSSTTATLSFFSDIEEKIFVVKLFPGLDPAIFDFLKSCMKGVIIESYGIGGVSSELQDIASKVRELTDAGVAVVLTTQCLQEGVSPTIYEVGRALPLDRIIFGKDMNTEALVPKLMWVLGKTNDPVEVKTLVETPFRDDILELPGELCYF